LARELSNALARLVHGAKDAARVVGGERALVLSPADPLGEDPLQRPADRIASPTLALRVSREQRQRCDEHANVEERVVRAHAEARGEEVRRELPKHDILLRRPDRLDPRALEETHDVDFANALLETGRDARARAKRARRDRVLHESIVPPSSADRSRERLEDLRSHDSRDRAPLDSRAEEHLSRKEEPASSKEVSRVDPSPMVGGAELAPRSV